MVHSSEQQNSSQGNMNGHVSVDVDALTSSLLKEVKTLHPIDEGRCIYRVREVLRELNEKAYTPRFVSIGPYHHGRAELKAMEDHKMTYLQLFLGHTEVGLDKFVSCVRDNETRLRNCYQEKIDLSSEMFVSIITVDAIFVIMVMLQTFSSQFHHDNELLHNKPWMINDVRYDMILLENQLPFFILEYLLELSNMGSFSMIEISSIFLNRRFSSWVVNPLEKLNFAESKHLVDFLRIGQQPLEWNRQEEVKALDVANLFSAVKLHQAGVKFKRGSSARLVDMSFRDGILEIPVLKLTRNREILIRNLLAFEQSHIDKGYKYFNNYISMMSLLVTSEKDVEIFIKNGIIETLHHSNEQVLRLLQNLAGQNHLSPKTFYFSDVVNGLNKYCSKRRNRWRASLIQNYFYSPWAMISVIAAVYIIMLTTIQTVCSILQL